MNQARYDELVGKFGAISVDIAKLTSKLGTAQAEELDALVEKLSKLEDRKKMLLTILAGMRNQERLEDEAARKTAEEKERNRKEQLFGQIQRRHQVCPECGSPAKIIEKPQQPQGITGAFWSTVDPTGKVWWVDYTCTNPDKFECATRFRLYPDLKEQSWE